MPNMRQFPNIENINERDRERKKNSSLSCIFANTPTNNRREKCNSIYINGNEYDAVCHGCQSSMYVEQFQLVCFVCPRSWSRKNKNEFQQCFAECTEEVFFEEACFGNRPGDAKPSTRSDSKSNFGSDPLIRRPDSKYHLSDSLPPAQPFNALLNFVTRLNFVKRPPRLTTQRSLEHHQNDFRGHNSRPHWTFSNLPMPTWALEEFFSIFLKGKKSIFILGRSTVNKKRRFSHFNLFDEATKKKRKVSTECSIFLIKLLWFSGTAHLKTSEKKRIGPERE